MVIFNTVANKIKGLFERGSPLCTYLLYLHTLLYMCICDDPLPIFLLLHAGVLSLHSIVPRLPFASNHLGISEDSTVALLCCLMELFDENADNARSAEMSHDHHVISL